MGLTNGKTNNTTNNTSNDTLVPPASPEVRQAPNTQPQFQGASLELTTTSDYLNNTSNEVRNSEKTFRRDLLNFFNIFPELTSSENDLNLLHSLIEQLSEHHLPELEREQETPSQHPSLKPANPTLKFRHSERFTSTTLKNQQDKLENILNNYMENAPQRDDMTVIGIRL